MQMSKTVAETVLEVAETAHQAKIVVLCSTQSVFLLNYCVVLLCSRRRVKTLFSRVQWGTEKITSGPVAKP
jgi:hypothetical protein